ncbi:MAG TPA: ATP-binding protein [Vicinamibacteria bacterium]
MRARSGKPARKAALRPRAAKTRKAALVLRFPSDTAFLGLVREVTKKMAEAAGFDAAVADGVALAVDEATTNVLEHAYGGATDREVELRFEDRGDCLRVEIVDSGATVDPKAVPRVDLSRYASERRKGGLGVHLMGKIMDSVTFRRDGRCNVCCLVKKKSAAPRP